MLLSLFFFDINLDLEWRRDLFLLRGALLSERLGSGSCGEVDKNIKWMARQGPLANGSSVSGLVLVEGGHGYWQVKGGRQGWQVTTEACIARE